MKSTREILQAIVTATPRITIDTIQANGDVAFRVAMKDLSLKGEDCDNPMVRTQFFVNFAGELFVRENIQKFATILTGLDSALHKKIVCSSDHADFGMLIDYKKGTLIFQMHLSLVQDIMTEGQCPDRHVQPDGPTFADMFDQSKPPKDDTEEKE